MKLAHLTSVYPAYAERFYAARPGLAAGSFSEQREALFYDAFAWADAWKAALQPLGYEVEELISNVAPMQRAWEQEHLSPAPERDLDAIAVEQVRRFRPDVLWFDHHDARLLRRIREQVPAIRLVLGWTGSAMPRENAYADCDMVLSCSRESVERLAALGHRAAELHHGFDPRVLQRLQPSESSAEMVFIGQIIRGSEFHVAREKLLERLADALPLRIFSPAPPRGLLRGAKQLVKRGLGAAFRAVGSSQRAERWAEAERPVVNPRLAPHMVDGVYGLEMYRTVRDAKVTLNSHADSSDRYASNMRLFEVTGVGGCLLTDWKPNLGEIFSLDSEVSAYRSADECVEKARWLLDHPQERAAMARAGQARTLREHTFARRASDLDGIVKNALSAAAVHVAVH
ncbi:hypothetical protein AYO46_06650 [Betaproteobacteria bacterium SCGC AG-212-J23]|nr:hypothetical protein AYO46_06650 [Betaproteobacteria bacterium SCGC AG-212-J23]